MLKRIMVTGILSITIAVLHAKTIITSQPLIPTSISGIIEEGLVNRLAVDNDFKKYYISNVEFANKVIETKAGALFLKYLQHKATPNEQEELFVKMKVTKDGFNAIGVKLKNEALTFMQKFPELKQFGEKEQKELLVNAFKKLSVDNSITAKFVKARIVTLEECFWYWMACLGTCSIGCAFSENYNDCYWTCVSFCSGDYGLCWVIAS